MRTTLDIDDDVLQAAKELAKAEKKTAGEVISGLARKGLTGAAAETRLVLKNGWYLLPRTGAVITSEFVEELLERADLEDAGLVTDR